MRIITVCNCKVCNYCICDFFTLCPFSTLEHSEPDFNGSGWGWEVNPVPLCQHNKFLFIWWGCSFRLHASVTQLPKSGLCMCVFCSSYLNGPLLKGVEILDGGLDSLPFYKKNGGKTCAEFLSKSLLYVIRKKMVMFFSSRHLCKQQLFLKH